jgi:hypothetical protein
MPLRTAVASLLAFFTTLAGASDATAQSRVIVVSDAD